MRRPAGSQQRDPRWACRSERRNDASCGAPPWRALRRWRWCSAPALPTPGADPGDPVDPGPPAFDLFEGGTYPIEIAVAPQTVTTDVDLFGLAQCEATTTTPSIDIDGTLTVAPAEIAPGLDRVVIPGATLELPGSRVSVGSLSLTCDGEHVGSIGVSVEFDATASVGAAVLDVGAASLSLADPTISITDASATFAGGPAGDTVVELDPITVTVPTVSVDV